MVLGSGQGPTLRRPFDRLSGQTMHLTIETMVQWADFPIKQSGYGKVQYLVASRIRNDP
jgi:hypothetical protein